MPVDERLARRAHAFGVDLAAQVEHDLRGVDVHEVLGEAGVEQQTLLQR
ncbi:hypothetical protein GCM10009855_08380 [Gordonia cholesterolivorans]|uniref:Uncharacterized protein n=1 Tax=Gordonia cholesterolivorans TaxID=559625 RepID=A0ABN3H7D2_9ACTN